MAKDRIPEEAAALFADALLFCAAAGVIGSAMNTMFGASSAFTTRLLDEARHASQLSTLQTRSLASALADLQAGRLAAAAASQLSRVVTAPPPGAPVVT